ncbi:MAG: hypothetical protein FWC36_09750 [Spirochaetes bacterium]|nr:hypothetical protein [Spirochaetota bacterium]
MGKKKLQSDINNSTVKDTVNRLPPFNKDDLHNAQELVYDAWDELNDKKRIALAKKALSISPYCIDAYVIIAESSKSKEECLKLYSQAIELGKKALGKEFFKENKGYFWGILETRPFMRAMAGLADIFWALGDRKKAIETYQEMLLLNPNDNQGIRYILINWLISENELEPAEKILTDYPENSAFMLYSKTLLHFKKNDKVKAKNALKKGIIANPHVAEFLLNPKKKYVPELQAEKMFGGYSPGRASEADAYRYMAGEVWQNVSGALKWLSENISK